MPRLRHSDRILSTTIFEYSSATLLHLAIISDFAPLGNSYDSNKKCPLCPYTGIVRSKFATLILWVKVSEDKKWRFTLFIGQTSTKVHLSISCYVPTWLPLPSNNYSSIYQSVFNRASWTAYSCSTAGDQPTQLKFQHHAHLSQ